MKENFSTENKNFAESHPAVEALKIFQKAMEGEAEKADLDTEEKIVALTKELRRENFC